MFERLNVYLPLSIVCINDEQFSWNSPPHEHGGEVILSDLGDLKFSPTSGGGGAVGVANLTINVPIPNKKKTLT